MLVIVEKTLQYPGCLRSKKNMDAPRSPSNHEARAQGRDGLGREDLSVALMSGALLVVHDIMTNALVVAEEGSLLI